jgi:hypothetical protein
MPERHQIVVAWTCVGAFLVADLVWLPFSRLTFAHSGLIQTTQFALLVAAVAWIPWFVRHRLGNDESKAAHLIRAGADGTSLMIHTAAFNLALFVAGVTFAYLSVTLALPLRDGELAAIDRALGFDWLAFLRSTNSYPVVASVLTTAYHTSYPQIILLFVFLSVTRRGARLAEFLGLLGVTTLFTGIGMVLVPAEGAYAYYRPPPEDFSNYSALAGMWHHEAFTALRTQLNPVLDFLDVPPLVTFPSFHTILAIIVTYAVRDVRYLILPVTTLNCIVVVATIPEGGHHLMDIIAGGGIAALGIALIRRARFPFSNARINSLEFRSVSPDEKITR